jgi:hypothetical protein
MLVAFMLLMLVITRSTASRARQTVDTLSRPCADPRLALYVVCCSLATPLGGAGTSRCNGLAALHSVHPPSVYVKRLLGQSFNFWQVRVRLVIVVIITD